ncbi:hypothetical protein HMPREF1503_0953 [Olsenella uli MSTE5]|nr:hypothetical protein HMPREF1503_0953 [Olsenella uli MSTE5]
MTQQGTSALGYRGSRHPSIGSPMSDRIPSRSLAAGGARRACSSLVCDGSRWAHGGR